MEYFAPALTVFFISFAALVSPGPDFLCVLRNALGYGFRTGFLTALGISFGIYVHVAYCMIGLALVISRSVVLFNALKWIGAAYLVWLAVQAFRSKGWTDTGAECAGAKVSLSPRRALTQGFATNVLNPKATLFFMALFTQVIDPETPMAVQAAYGVMCSLMTLCWFTAVAAAMTRPAIRARFARLSVWFDRACGAAFVALAARLAFARA